MTRRAFGGLFAALLANLAVGGLSGCGSSSKDSQTNPDLKVPDVPPGDRGKKGGGPGAKPPPR